MENANTGRSERILCAAVHFDDGKEYINQPIGIKSGYVVCGHRHHNCYMTVSILKDNITIDDKGDIQGFLTDTNRFVDRKDAVQIALHSGQLHCIERLNNPRVGLFSEDLY